MVFCRVIVERFDKSRGIALSLIMSAPPLAGAITAPIMADIIGSQGWRAGYLAMAAITAVGGLIAISLMGRVAHKRAARNAVVSLTRAELFSLLRNPVLLLLIGGMILVNLPQSFAQSQLKLIALDNGVSDASATAMVSLYAVGVIIGRFLTGVALDSRVRPHMVAIVALGLPAIGYGLFASGTAVAAILMAGVLLVGLAQGAESDVGAYLLSRRFDLKNFSLLLSFLTMSMGIGSAVGSLVLSYTLYLTDSYLAFLVLAAVGTLAGAVAFGLTGAKRWQTDEPREANDAVLEQALAGELS